MKELREKVDTLLEQVRGIFSIFNTLVYNLLKIPGWPDSQGYEKGNKSESLIWKITFLIPKYLIFVQPGNARDCARLRKS
jgi:hypothetical protein